MPREHDLQTYVHHGMNRYSCVSPRLCQPLRGFSASHRHLGFPQHGDIAPFPQQRHSRGTGWSQLSQDPSCQHQGQQILTTVTILALGMHT